MEVVWVTVCSSTLQKWSTVRLVLTEGAREGGTRDCSYFFRPLCFTPNHVLLPLLPLQRVPGDLKTLGGSLIIEESESELETGGVDLGLKVMCGVKGREMP